MLWLAGRASAAPKPMAAAPLANAEAAVAQMAQGNYREAALAARQALRSAPDDPTLCTLAGALLLDTGDAKGALTAFQNATAGGGGDSLTYYGLGLAQLACGDTTAALTSFQRSRRSGGDPAYLFVAERYAQWLSGAQMTLDGASLPDTFTAALHALQGMADLRRGDSRQAAAALKAALAGLPGEMVVQPAGLLMTFDRVRPLTTAGRPLPPNHGLNAPLPKERALGGALTLTPEGLSPSVAYVSYEVDGAALSLVNVAPFQYTWDTAGVPNGWHTLAIVLYDKDGREMNRVERRIRTSNAGAEALATASPERTERLRNALWKLVALRPDRCACAYVLGGVHRALGEPALARAWFARAAAIHPDYRDTRQQLASLGGLGGGGEAVWGGLPTEKAVALTFDDGPKPGITEALLDVLTQYKVPSTFFVVGRQVTLYPELTRKIAEAGMEIANHSYSHTNLTTLPAQALAREILRTQAVVETVTGKTPRYLRPPGGNWNGEVAQMVRRWGLTPCFWTVDVYGSEVIGAQQVADAVLAQVRPGSIVLMHNGKMSTVQALPTIIRVLRSRGYTFLTVEEMARRLASARDSARAARVNVAPPARRTE
jgi:peptidoglycan/xylan/chitin deacetylase (PgdA/CDA1 family)